MKRAIAGAGLFDLPFPAAPPRVRRSSGRVVPPGARLLPASVEDELSLAVSSARRRHPSARRRPATDVEHAGPIAQHGCDDRNGRLRLTD